MELLWSKTSRISLSRHSNKLVSLSTRYIDTLLDRKYTRLIKYVIQKAQDQISCYGNNIVSCLYLWLVIALFAGRKWRVLNARRRRWTRKTTSCFAPKTHLSGIHLNIIQRKRSHLYLFRLNAFMLMRLGELSLNKFGRERWYRTKRRREYRNFQKSRCTNSSKNPLYTT